MLGVGLSVCASVPLGQGECGEVVVCREREAVRIPAESEHREHCGGHGGRTVCRQRWGCQCCWLWGGEMKGGMHIMEKPGGARMPCRGGCGCETGTCSPFLLCVGELLGCGLLLLHVCVYLWEGKSWRAPGQRSELLQFGLAAGKVFGGSKGQSWDG